MTRPHAFGASLAMVLSAVASLAWAKDHDRVLLLYEDPFGSNQCKHFTWETKIEMSKANDKLRWLIINTCPRSQHVILCSYKGGTWDRDVFERRCQSPNNEDMNTPFEVRGNSQVELKCKANKTNGALLYADAANAPSPCPTPTPPARRGHEKRDHRIDIEIAP